MTRRCLVVFPGLVALGVERRSLRVQGSNRLREEENHTVSSTFCQMVLISGGARLIHFGLTICIPQIFSQSSFIKAVDGKLADATLQKKIDVV